MADHGITYSRLVAFLKVILPLSALALLSTLFLISSKIGGSSSNAIPFARVDLEQRAREQQITAPFFSGKTSAGHLVSFTAEKARPDPKDPLKSQADEMDATIELTDGSQLKFASKQALINNRTFIATLKGDVVIQSSSGYTLRTEELNTSMRELGAESPGTILAMDQRGSLKQGKWKFHPQNIQTKSLCISPKA